MNIRPSDSTVFKTRRNELSNRLLDAMETRQSQADRSHLKPIKLKLGAVVCDAGGILKHAYFPEGAVLSLLTVSVNGSAIETANIGRGRSVWAFCCDVQPRLLQSVSSCKWMPAIRFAARSNCFSRNSRTANTYAIFSSATRKHCFRRFPRLLPATPLHSTEERMCRWLLMMHDRAEGAISLPYTHEFLSHMFGRQSKIGDACGAIRLQKAGLITYLLGKYHSLLDRPGLEKASVRMLRGRKGALRCLREAPGDGGSR